MNPDRFGLDEILRYFSSGTIFLASFAYSRGGVFNIPDTFRSTAGIAILSLLAFTIGALVYSIHRSIIYWALGRLNLRLARCIIKKSSKNSCWKFTPFIVTNDEYLCDKWRWRERQGNQVFKPRLDEWGSQIHLLYTSTLAIWAGSLIGVYSLDNVVFNPFLFWSGLGTLFCGWISDLRRRHIEIRLMQEL